MREIKFRAWDTQLKTYTYSGYGEKSFVIFVKRTNCSRYIIEQYTDYEDINDKLIFAGDKIKTYRFICKNGKQAIEYYNKIISSEDFHHDCYILGNIIDSGRTVEIIGNIHEAK